MQNFWNLKASEGNENFFDKPLKGTLLPDITHFEPLIVQICSQAISVGEPTTYIHYYSPSNNIIVSNVLYAYSNGTGMFLRHVRMR